MFKASSLLLLTLILKVQLNSSAPISARVVQCPVVAEEPGPEEPHTCKELVQEKLIPVIAVEAPPSPEESPAEEDIAVAVREPEPEPRPVPVEDALSADADEAVSQGSDPWEPLAAAQQESSEEETVLVEAAMAEASPDETRIEVAPIATEERESPDQQDVEDPAQEAPIVVIPVNTSEDEEKSVVLVPAEPETEEVVQEEPAVDETAPEESGPEEPAVIVPVESAEEDPEEQTKEEDAVVPLVLEEYTEEHPATDEEPEEESVVLVPVEPEETIPIISLETTKEESPEEQAKEDALVPIVLEENAEEDPATEEEPEEEFVVLVPVDPETKEEDEVEPAAEETAPEESAPEHPVVIVPVDSSEGEPAQEEEVAEETIPNVFPEASKEEAAVTVASVDPEEEAPEDNTEEEVVQSDPLPGLVPLEEDLNLNITSEENEQEALIEAPVEPEGVPALAGGNGTSNATEDFKAAVTLIEEEPVAVVNRGAVLGAALFTLMSFITIGFVWMAISKKLR
ncbi:fibrous sheath CABYR-binding protein [Lates calcarifer]|uniref:Fibrous sheath CABYR-binding protein n=1 Tax=Lates calcarifer TaxID=8187 RepID=A0AAJ7QHN8_LATCA|nr:fibrous sheath CABYR-binding protein [Lates calcarifer]